MGELSGKTAIVAGGGRGIGRACAEALADSGAHVVIGSRTISEIEAATDHITAQGGRADGFPLDVSSRESVQGFTEKALQISGAIDILVYAAGTVARGRIADLTEKDWLRVIDVNLNGAFRVCQTVGRHMREQQIGAIVTITSMQSHVTTPNVGAYAPSKGGLLLLTQLLAVEWASYNIRVNAVSPGYISTALNRDALERPSFKETLHAKTPQNRYGTIEEIAQAVVFLASPRASFITGAALPVDGGFLAGHPHIRPGEM